VNPQHVALGELLAKRKRGITRFQITESIHAVKFTPAQRRALAHHPELRWVPLAELDRVALSGPHRRWITELLQSQSEGRPERAGRDPLAPLSGSARQLAE
jgi:hypothetical protein